MSALPEQEQHGPSRLKRTRQQVSLACGRCRKRKIACDGVTPECGPCGRRKVECCYSQELRFGETRQAALKRQLAGAHELLAGIAGALDLLKNLPETEVAQLVQRVASASDPVRALADVQAVMPPAALLSSSTPRSSLPSALTGLESELMMWHPLAYAQLTWIDPSALPRNLSTRLIELDAPSVPVELHFFSSVQSPLPSISTARSEKGDLPAGPGRKKLKDGPKRTAISFLTTEAGQTPARYCDARLKLLSIRFWTDVPISDEHAAQLISHYLAVEHPLLGFFDADLFVRDLVLKEQRFCSRFLVHALLYWGCFCYPSRDSCSDSFRRCFLAEARKTWSICHNQDSILSVAACEILSLSCACDGNDRLASYYKWEGCLMGQRLKLLGVDGKAAEDPDAHRHLQPDELKATAHVAWGLFSYLTFHSHCYREVLVRSLPPFAIPGDHDAGAEHLVDNDSDVPPYMGRTFAALCNFRRIHWEIIQIYYASDARPIAERVSLRFAEEKYRQLLQWADALHVLTKRGHQQPHHVINLHIWYHTALRDLFRPFLGRNLRLELLRSEDDAPEVVLAASLQQVKALAVAYHYSQPSASYSILWHTSLLYIGNSVLRDMRCQDWRFYYLLCIESYVNLFAHFRIAGGFVLGLLWLAINSGRISVDDAWDTVRRLSSDGQGHITGEFRSAHVVDLELIASDRHEAHMEAVVEKLSDLTAANEVAKAQKVYNPSPNKKLARAWI